MRALIIFSGCNTRKGWVAFKGNTTNSSWLKCQQGEHWEDLDAWIKRWMDAKVHGWINGGWREQMIGQLKQWSGSGWEGVLTQVFGKDYWLINRKLNYVDAYYKLICCMSPVLNGWNTFSQEWILCSVLVFCYICDLKLLLTSVNRKIKWYSFFKHKSADWEIH